MIYQDPAVNLENAVSRAQKNSKRNSDLQRSFDDQVITMTNSNLEAEKVINKTPVEIKVEDMTNSLSVVNISIVCKKDETKMEPESEIKAEP